MPGKSAKKGKKKGKQSKAAQKGPVNPSSLIPMHSSMSTSTVSIPRPPRRFPHPFHSTSFDPDSPTLSDVMMAMMLDRLAMGPELFTRTFTEDNSSHSSYPPGWPASPEYDEKELHCSPADCTRCGIKLPDSPDSCSHCNVAKYCCKLHLEAHEDVHKSACVVLQSDAAAASPDATLIDHLQHALLRLLYDPDRTVLNLEALLHVLDGRMGRYSVRDLLDCSPRGTIATMVKKHELYGEGNRHDTPLESCKLATTILLVLCGQLPRQESSMEGFIEDSVPNHLMKSAGWLSESRGAFDRSHFKRPNGPEKVLRNAGTKAIEAMHAWHAQHSRSDAEVLRKGVCIAVSVTDCTAVRLLSMSSLHHTFALVIAPVATSKIVEDSTTERSTTAYAADIFPSPCPPCISHISSELNEDALQDRERFKFCGRVYQAFGPPSIGYSLRDNVYARSGSMHMHAQMSEKDIWDFVSTLEALQFSLTWRQAKPYYVELFGAAPKVGQEYPCELNATTRVSEFSEDSLICMRRMCATMLDISYAAPQTSEKKEI